MQPSFFDVHYWPAQGRVFVINQEPGLIPITTDIMVRSSAPIGDTTFTVALALAEAGRPTGELFCHQVDGSVDRVGTAGFERTNA